MAHSYCPLCGTKLIGQQQFARRCPQCQGNILRYDQEVEEEERRQRHREEMEAERIRQNSFSYKLTSLITSIIGGTVKLTLYIGIIIGGIFLIGWLTASPEQKAMIAPPTKQTTPAAPTTQKTTKVTNEAETTPTTPTENIEQITEEVIQPITIAEEESEDPILEKQEEQHILSEAVSVEKDPKQERAFRKAMKKEMRERKQNNRKERKKAK